MLYCFIRRFQVIVEYKVLVTENFFVFAKNEC